MKRLHNKVAIITGSVMGMGKEIAKLFAEEGAKVVMADFNELAGKEVVEEIVAQGGTALCMKYEIRQYMAGLTKAAAYKLSLIGRLGEPRAALNSYKQAVDRVGFLF